MAHWRANGSIIWFGSKVMPFPIILLAAIAVRLLLTGALHEDGLADFFDGFGGGGTNRTRILAIMKDSHIGTFGVLSLIFYFALLFSCMYALGPLYASAWHLLPTHSLKWWPDK